MLLGQGCSPPFSPPNSSSSAPPAGSWCSCPRRSRAWPRRMRRCGGGWAGRRVRAPRASLPRSCCCCSPSWSSCRRRTSGAVSWGWGQQARGLAQLQSPQASLSSLPHSARLENGREDERLHCAELEREVSELQQRNQALTSLAQEAQALKDEMDELR